MTDNVHQETLAAIRSCRASLPDEAGGQDVVFGFDGFVDRVRRMVDERRDGDEFDAIRTLDDLGDRISASAAADSSLSIEWLDTDVRTGGHVAHLSRAYRHLGFDPTMLGTFGEPVATPFREEFADLDRESFGEPGYTDAVEFADGKLMLMEVNATRELDWARVSEQCSPEEIAAHIDGADLLGLGYFADMPGLPSIATGLRTEVWPLLDEPPATILIDPGDVRKLDRERLREGIAEIAALDECAPVSLSANRYETTVLADAFDDGDWLGDDVDVPLGDAVDAVADALNVSRVVGHGVDRSVAVSDAGRSRALVPTIEDPEITTSAGDHFNVGLSLGLLWGLDDGAAVALGNAVASYFVQTGDQPGLDDLRSYLGEYESRIDPNE